MKKKIIICGCGFAGIAVLMELVRYGKDLDITIIDKKETFDFLPMLPDVLGRMIPPGTMLYSIRHLKEQLGFEFINDEIVSLDIKNKTLLTTQEKLSYDFIIIASGTQTNFYGNKEAESHSYKLDTVKDAETIFKKLEKGDFRYLLVSGGGYTGVEIATNLRIYLKKRSKKAEIIIVEKAPSILGPLPGWMKTYTSENLKKMDINIMTGEMVEGVTSGEISLSSGKKFDQAMLIWSAGVHTPAYVRDLDVEKNKQGRLKVDRYLRVSETCFAIGDCALFERDENALRMAVQFSIAEGEIAALNVINMICKRPLKEYKPIDLGYIIPMANNRSCGTILGVDMKGVAPTFLHYLMCAYRSYGISNKMDLLSHFLRIPRK